MIAVKNRRFEGWDRKKLLRLIVAAACVEILFLIVLSFFTKPNIAVSLLLLLSFQIPIAASLFCTSPRIYRICRRCSLMLLTAGAVVLLACYGRNSYIKSVTPADTSSIDTELYRPFDDSSLVARLDEESILHLEEDLPVLNGSETLFPFYSAVVDMVYPETIGELNKKGSPYRFGGTAAAYKELLEGKTDIVFSESPSKEILKRAKELGIELKLIPIGHEALVFFTNSSNIVSGLSSEQIRSIYSGVCTDWSEVGGDELPITAFQAKEGTAVYHCMKAFMGDVPMKSSQKKFSFEMDSDTDYYNESGAIGYSFLHYARSLNVDKGMNLLAVDNIYPYDMSIIEDEYPLAERIYCVVVENRVSENARKLISWITDVQGQRLLEKSGYLPNS